MTSTSTRRILPESFDSPPNEFKHTAQDRRRSDRNPDRFSDRLIVSTRIRPWARRALRHAGDLPHLVFPLTRREAGLACVSTRRSIEDSLAARTCLRERFASPTSKQPTQLPTLLSVLVDCPTGDSLYTRRCLPRCTAGTTFGQRPYTTRLRPKTQPLGNPRFVASGAVVFANGTCELNRKRRFPLTQPTRTGDTAGWTQNR